MGGGELVRAAAFGEDGCQERCRAAETTQGFNILRFDHLRTQPRPATAVLVTLLPMAGLAYNVGLCPRR